MVFLSKPSRNDLASLNGARQGKLLSTVDSDPSGYNSLASGTPSVQNPTPNLSGDKGS